MSLSTKAILFSLKISVWTARKQDQKATSTVETSFSTQKKVGNYTKKLLPDAKELENVKAIAEETRKFFRDQTLPWLSDGTRIVSAKNYFELTQELRKRKDSFERSVSEFLGAYETLRNDAANKLGALFNAADYPTANELRSSFKFDLTPLPMPEISDFRTEVLDSEKNEFLAKMREVENESIRHCYAKLSEVVSRAVEKLKTPDAKFKDSLIENIADICRLLPKLNIHEDSALEATRREVESLVSKISPDTIRENKLERETTAKKLADIDSKISALMGGKA